MIKKGQSDNTAWFRNSYCFKGGCGYVNMWSLCQKISGLTSINPNISAFKYGRDMEQHASNAFFENFKYSQG